MKPLTAFSESKPTSSQVLKKALHKPKSDAKRKVKKPLEIQRRSETSHLGALRETKWLIDKGKS